MSTPWIPHPTILRGETVDLLPLELSQFDELYTAASDPALWALIPVNCSIREKFDQAYLAAIADREAGRQYPFVVFHKPSGKLIGSTRFFEIYPADKKLEIGWTWIVQEHWGSSVNFECKLLLLDFCFDVLQTRRVQLKTKDTNIRSRTAIEKIGGVFEGVLRKDRVQDDGSSRNAAYFSILDDEWPAARRKILEQLTERRKKQGS